MQIKKCKLSILLICIIGIAVLMSGCTININMNSPDEIISEENSAADSNTAQKTTENIRTRVPQAAIRGMKIESGIKLEHQGGDNVNLAETKIMLGSNMYSPLCSYDQMFNEGDVITVDKYSGDFRLNGNLMDVNTPSTPYNTIGGIVTIKIIDLITNQLVVDIKIAGV